MNIRSLVPFGILTISLFSFSGFAQHNSAPADPKVAIPDDNKNVKLLDSISDTTGEWLNITAMIAIADSNVRVHKSNGNFLDQCREMQSAVAEIKTLITGMRAIIGIDCVEKSKKVQIRALYGELLGSFSEYFSVENSEKDACNGKNGPTPKLESAYRKLLATFKRDWH